MQINNGHSAGDEAAPGGRGGAGRGGAREQRRGREAVRGVPSRVRRGGLDEDDTGEPVGAHGSDGGGAAGDGGAWEGRRRQHRIWVNGGDPLLPPLHHLCRHQTVSNICIFFVFYYDSVSPCMSCCCCSARFVASLEFSTF